jgi:hypothetical protein
MKWQIQKKLVKPQTLKVMKPKDQLNLTFEDLQKYHLEKISVYRSEYDLTKERLESLKRNNEQLIKFINNYIDGPTFPQQTPSGPKILNPLMKLSKAIEQ